MVTRATNPNTPTRPDDLSIREFCLELLESGELEAKLRRPRTAEGLLLEDRDPGPSTIFDAPARSGELVMTSGSDRLPHLHELADRHAAAHCLERFANHELMAIELFAWVLLAYPEMPGALRRGFLAVLEEEQRHLQLYLDRLGALGSGLGNRPLTDYFWKQVPALKAASDGPLTFLCVMGLTFEQANLDYSLLYRDAFRQAGDEESATSIDQVHRDEIRHVRLASIWSRRLAGRHRNDVEIYTEHVPFPLSAARAKGKRFDVAARKKAGLSEEFIAFVRESRPYENVRRAE